MPVKCECYSRVNASHVCISEALLTLTTATENFLLLVSTYRLMFSL